MPEINFQLVGLSGGAMAEAQRIAPPNVRLSEPVPFDALQKIYHSTRVICQFSRQESFGIALLEGLAAGCVPVITNRCGPAEVFAGTNVPSIDELKPSHAVEAIRAAFQMEPSKLEEIQQKVLSRFDCAVRKQKLLDIISQC